MKLELTGELLERVLKSLRDLDPGTYTDVRIEMAKQEAKAEYLKINERITLNWDCTMRALAQRRPEGEEQG